jgi:hypothetical protein
VLTRPGGLALVGEFWGREAFQLWVLASAIWNHGLEVRLCPFSVLCNGCEGDGSGAAFTDRAAGEIAGLILTYVKLVGDPGEGKATLGFLQNFHPARFSVTGHFKTSHFEGRNSYQVTCHKHGAFQLLH